MHIRLLSFTIAILVGHACYGGYIENRSYDTLCAEVDNINIPLYSSGVTAYRIVATHPDYYPTSIDERGPDFTDCDFADRQIWLIGEKDVSEAEFRQDGFNDGDVHYAPDNPPAGIDHASTNFPKEINLHSISNQYIRFTADEPGDFNHTLIIGAWLEVAFVNSDGTLEIECLTGDGTNWVSHGTQVFNDANRIRRWDIPDFTWIEGVDANFIHLRVLPADSSESTSGCWGVYDYVELHKRDEGGETVDVLYDDGTNKVEAIHIDFWWRAPRAMSIHVEDGNSSTNAHYLRMIQRVPESDPAQYDEIFILYQDANARIHPHAPSDLDPNWVPYGASVQIGATPESDRPYADIETVWVYPQTHTVDIHYEDSSFAQARLRVDRTRSIVDVRHITFDTATLPFARFRSMWVRDGNDDIQRVLHRLGQFPIMHLWDELEGTWWYFHRASPSYHNTYAPDFFIEILEPSPAFDARAAESPDDSTNATVAVNSHAATGSVLLFPASGGEAEYDIDLTRPWLNVFLRAEYSDPAGGRTVTIHHNDQAAGSWTTAPGGDTNLFAISPNLALGDLTAGVHRIAFEVGAGTSGLSLDRFELVSRPEPLIDEVLIAEIEHETGPSLRNASFENGSGNDVIDNWTRWDGLSREDWAERSGDWGVMMQGWTTGGGIYQDIASAAVGKEYVFSIWGNPTWDWQFDHFDVSIFIQFLDATNGIIEAHNLTEADLTGSVDTWTPYSVQGVSPTGTVTVRFGMEFGGVVTAGEGAFRFDDASLQHDPAVVELAQAYSNAYLSVRYAETEEPSRVDIHLNDDHRAVFPTENTGGTNVFVWSPLLYPGALPSDTSTVEFASAGLAMDRFKLITLRRVNRAPDLEVPLPMTLVMGSTTNFTVAAYDLDGDDVSVTNTLAPDGATFENNVFTWTAVPGYGGTTQEIVFAASDPHGDTNSTVTMSAWIAVPYDSDEDGLPDDWEWFHFASLTNAPGDDPDGNGMSNFEEYIAGTNPTNAASVFRVTSVTELDTPPGRKIGVATQPERLYTILFTDGPLTNDVVWYPFANPAGGIGTWFETNLLPSVFTFTDDHGTNTTLAPPLNNMRFYRVLVEWP